MAKRPVKKKTATKSSMPKKVHTPCIMQPCKKTTAYMRTVWDKDNTKSTKEHYCADHWKSVVESKKAFAQVVARSAKEQHDLRLKKGGLKDSVKSASSKPRRKVKIKK